MYIYDLNFILLFILVWSIEGLVFGGGADKLFLLGIFRALCCYFLTAVCNRAEMPD